MMDKAVILLSGGLDSLVALGYAINKSKYNVELALTFDYGQKALKSEIEASEKISSYYGVKHKIIELEWLKEITQTALVAEADLPDSDFETNKSANQVWVPNRNALFLNIAAAFCDSFGSNYIIYGANKDESKTFPDNTEEFRSQISKTFESSTLVKPKVVAPLINYTKSDIVRIAVEGSMPLDLVMSCYNSIDKHCGRCESCYHLKKALIANNREDIIEKLF